MASHLKELLDHFPVGTAEGERQLLAKVYVKQDAFADLISAPSGSPRLLVGRKGTGKTAILEYTSAVLQASSVPYLSLKPLDLELPVPQSNTPIATLTRTAYRVIVESVAASLGTQQTGLLSADEYLLYEQAIEEGKVKRDLVGRTARLLSRLAKPVIKVDFSTLFPESRATAEELRNAIAGNIADNGKAFFLFIDDTDTVASPSSPDHLNHIWAFLLASRELTQKVSGMRVVVTLRDEVWRRLIRDQAGQRDQADHFLPLVRELIPTREHIRAVLDRRLALAAVRCGVRATSPYEVFFEGHDARMPQTEARRSWEDLIVLRSRERPRDAIQLIQALATRAMQRGGSKISEADFHVEMPQFSAQRVLLLAQEVEAECPQIREIIDSFAAIEYDYGSFKLTADVLRSHLRSVPARFSTSLFGRTLQPDDDDAAFALWSFLYELGIINARVADMGEEDGFRHVQPRDDATLVSKARWGDMQGMAWEVNPAYRDFLILKQKEDARRTGLPPKRPAGRHRF